MLYVAGWGRSGSTILDNVLNQIDGFFSVGEIVYLWERNLIEDDLCGCGAKFSKCDVWRSILDEAYGGIDQAQAHEMIRRRDGGARTRHLPLLLSPWGKTLLNSRLDKYQDNLACLYRGVQRATGSRVIVDSSKLPSYGYVLDLVPEIDLYVVHLVRDPRAVAYSWLRKGLQPGKEELMGRHGAATSALVWNLWNLAVEMLWKRRSNRYLRLRYEDFVDDPEQSIRSILGLLGESVRELPIEGSQVELGPNHTTSGNRSRFKTGEVELRIDREWQSKMKKSDKRIVTALCWPLLRRYGY